MRVTPVLVSLLCFVATASALAVDEPDLVFYFPFESINGDTALDQSGRGHNGTINGNINLAEDPDRGKVAEFEMASFIDLDGPNIPPEDIPTDAFSICAWIKCDNTGQDHGIFNARAADSTWLIHPDIRGGGQYRFCLRGNGGADICNIIAGAVAWDEWLHYAGTYSVESGKATLYINGEVIQEVNASAEVGVASDWGLGARIGYNIDNERPFTGLMDDFCIWKKELTAEEVQTVMADGPLGAAVSPLGSITTTWGVLKTF